MVTSFKIFWKNLSQNKMMMTPMALLNRIQITSPAQAGYFTWWTIKRHHCSWSTVSIRSTGASCGTSPGQNLQQATVTDGILQVESSTSIHTTLLLVPPCLLHPGPFQGHTCPPQGNITCKSCYPVISTVLYGTFNKCLVAFLLTHSHASLKKIETCLYSIY